MPATPSGTVYTMRDFTPAGGDLSRYAVADHLATATGIRTLLYCHGAGGLYDDFSVAQWNQMRHAIIDAGWAYIEGTGGGDITWGNNASRSSYEKAFQHVDGILDLGPVVVLGRSGGGLVAAWLGTQSPVIAPRCAGMIFNSATQDLAYRFAQGPNDIAPAYGIANINDPAEYQTKTAGHDPMLFPLSAWQGRNAMWLVGTADTTVPPGPHGIAMHTRAAPALARAVLRTVQGADHSPANGTYNEVAAMMAFLSAVAPAPLAVPGRTVRSVRLGGRTRAVRAVRRATA
jgi:pimeloyl-ACP methyl ester carboxylesterase